jgi:hypothetical protein
MYELALARTYNLLVRLIVESQGWKGIPWLSVTTDELGRDLALVEQLVDVLRRGLLGCHHLEAVQRGVDLVGLEVALRQVLGLLKPDCPSIPATASADVDRLEGVAGVCVRPTLMFLQGHLRTGRVQEKECSVQGGATAGADGGLARLADIPV